MSSSGSNFNMIPIINNTTNILYSDITNIVNIILTINNTTYKICSKKEKERMDKIIKIMEEKLQCTFTMLYNIAYFNTYLYNIQMFNMKIIAVKEYTESIINNFKNNKRYRFSKYIYNWLSTCNQLFNYIDIIININYYIQANPYCKNAQNLNNNIKKINKQFNTDVNNSLNYLTTDNSSITIIKEEEIPEITTNIQSENQASYASILKKNINANDSKTITEESKIVNNEAILHDHDKDEVITQDNNIIVPIPTKVIDTFIPEQQYRSSYYETNYQVQMEVPLVSNYNVPMHSYMYDNNTVYYNQQY